MRRWRRPFPAEFAVAAVAALLLTACRPDPEAVADDVASSTLRVGVARMMSNPGNGLRQLAQNITVELLADFTEEGRLRPWLARDWAVSADGLGLTVNLPPDVKLHDGSALTAAVVVKALQTTLPDTMGPAFEDVDAVTATSEHQVVVRFRHPSPFLLDSLEAPIQKPGAPLVGTGPFVVSDPNSPTEFRANAAYHLGRPKIDRIVVESFPSVRAAWAELLRGRLDMLYEVGIDALDSLETSTSISTFTFTRHYQHIVVLNTRAEVFRSKDARRAVNMGIDREGLVREALNGHGVVSSGPVWPYHYAFRADFPKFEFNSAAAAKAARAGSGSAGGLRFTCLIPPDAVNERIGLVMKRQLAGAGIEMTLKESTQDEVYQSLKAGRFDAALIEGVSAPTLLRPYQLWHSNGAANAGGLGSAVIDEAFDRVRRSKSDEEYKQRIAELQQTFIDDPPGIFLAWSERARAVSKRFAVPTPEPVRDIVRTIRLWTPVTIEQRTSPD
jgi:peptide/nickel transport system substrate-binding protein